MAQLVAMEAQLQCAMGTAPSVLVVVVPTVTAEVSPQPILWTTYP